MLQITKKKQANHNATKNRNRFLTERKSVATLRTGSFVTLRRILMIVVALLLFFDVSTLIAKGGDGTQQPRT
jgi:hypothetical protein